MSEQVATAKDDAPEVSLTTDVSEGSGDWTIADDEALLDVVTSAKVARGFHAGDPDIIRRTWERWPLGTVLPSGRRPA